MVVNELEDHALASAFQHILGGVQLPAGVGHWVSEGPEVGARAFVRGRDDQAAFAEDPCQGGHRRGVHAEFDHLVVDADRAVVPAGFFQGFTHGHGLVFDSFAGGAGRGFRASGAGLQCCGLPCGTGSFQDLVERFAADFVLGAERGDSPSGCVVWPSGDGKAYRRVNWIIFHEYQFTSPPTWSSYRWEGCVVSSVKDSGEVLPL